MKLSYKNVTRMTLFLFVFTIIFSCSKDTDLLLSSVLNDPEVALEDKATMNEELLSGDLVTRTFTFSPTNDAYIQNDLGYDKSIVRLEEGSRTSYLMFDLSPINGVITDAVLQFYIDSDEGDGSIAVHKGSSADWTEETLNSSNAPIASLQLGITNKSYKVGSPEKVILDPNDLSAEVTSLILTHNSGNDLAFASKEHPSNSGPKLIIVYAAPADAPLIEQVMEETVTQEEVTTPAENTTQEETTTQQETTSQGETTSQEETTTSQEETNPNTAATEGAYYVTTNGKATNNGRSEANAWSIEHAFESAVAGDVVYIKAGNYGNRQLVADNSGYANNPIKFIGYTNTPGDLVSDKGSTFKYGDQIDSSKMPLINGGRSGTGILIPEDYVQIENFQITQFKIGINSVGTNLTLRNIIVTDQGSQSNYDAYDGFGLQIKGNNSLLENCFVLNMTAEAIRLFDSDNSRVNYCSVHADNPNNPTDYYFLLAGGTNNTIIENSYAERAQGLRHGGHGFDLKDLAENNIIRNCTAKRTNFELNFSGVKNNIIQDSFIYGVDTSSANWHAGVLIANGANSNLIKNMYIENTWAAIRFMDDDDGYVGPGGDRDELSLGYNNTFDNIIVNNTNRIINVGSGNYIGARTYGNNFTNCDFSNFDSVAIAYFKAENNLFKNCKFSNGNKFIVEVEAYSSFTATWDNCTWSNIQFQTPN